MVLCVILFNKLIWPIHSWYSRKTFININKNRWSLFITNKSYGRGFVSFFPYRSISIHLLFLEFRNKCLLIWKRYRLLQMIKSMTVKNKYYIELSFYCPFRNHYIFYRNYIFQINNILGVGISHCCLFLLLYFLFYSQFICFLWSDSTDMLK